MDIPKISDFKFRHIRLIYEDSNMLDYDNGYVTYRLEICKAFINPQIIGVIHVFGDEFSNKYTFVSDDFNLDTNEVLSQAFCDYLGKLQERKQESLDSRTLEALETKYE